VTPALRFPDFDGDWLTGKLGDVFTFKNGVNADKSMYGSGRKFINVMDVIADAPIYHDAIIGSVEISDKEFAKNEVVFGDILFQRSSETREEVGQSNIYLDEKPATFGGFVIRGHPKKPIISRYFDALLKTSAVRKDVTSRSGGSTRYNIGQESLEAVAICIAPTDAEQQKISDFIVAVDQRIKLLQRRQDAVQQYKQGMMQRIFSQSIRFKRDDGSAFPEWSDTTLGDVAFIDMGQSPDSSSYNDNGIGIPLIQGNADIRKRVSAPRRFTSSPTKLSEVGDILLSVRAPVGEVSKAIHVACIGRGMAGIRKRQNNDQEFIFQYLLNYEPQWISLGQGSTFTAISGPDIRKLGVRVPHSDEQRRIAAFLSALDDKIATVFAQVDQMQAFKKGLLQQMFV
jgi:type I restriction enzyme, S subunit